MEIKLDMLVAQIINFAIIFWLYKKYLAKHIIAAIEERRTLIKKLENADTEYEQMINGAKQEAADIVQEGVNKKNDLISQAGAVADAKQKDMIEKAHRQSEMIVKNAEEKAKLLEQEFEHNFEKGVKQTTEVVVKKLLKEDKNLQESYINELIKEATQK